MSKASPPSGGYVKMCVESDCESGSDCPDSFLVQTTPSTGKDGVDLTTTRRSRAAPITVALVLVAVIALCLLAGPGLVRTGTPPPASKGVEDSVTGHGVSVRQYTLTVSRFLAAPDGYVRWVIGANGQYPGPTIRGTIGDTMEITVINNLDVPTVIHWHGLYQEGTPWADGPAGITQCPIPAGQSLVYTFQLQQTGTYWWHGHFGTQAVDGLRGAFVIDPKPTVSPSHGPASYDYDYTVVLADWYHTDSTALLKAYLSPSSNGNEPPADSGLINGFGRFNCTGYSKDVCDDKRTLSNTYEVFPVAQSARYRFRIINAGAMAMFKFSIDGHRMTIIEADGTDVEPHTVDILSINVAQRYSVVVKMDQTPDNYWMRADLQSSCFPAGVKANMITEVLGIVSYEGVKHDKPKSTGVTASDNCLELDVGNLLSIPAQSAPQSIAFRRTLDVIFMNNAEGVNLAYFNNVSFVPPPRDVSLLGLASAGQPMPPQTNTLIFDLAQGAGAQIVINNRDTGDHPFHLHGYHFYVLGWGPPNAGDYAGQPLLNGPNDNPLRRDTLTVNAGSWAVISLYVTNPGVWFFHCHISWHIQAGLAMPFLTLPRMVPLLSQAPSAYAEMCLANPAVPGLGVIRQ